MYFSSILEYRLFIAKYRKVKMNGNKNIIKVIVDPSLINLNSSNFISNIISNEKLSNIKQEDIATKVNSLASTVVFLPFANSINVLK